MMMSEFSLRERLSRVLFTQSKFSTRVDPKEIMVAGDLSVLKYFKIIRKEYQHISFCMLYNEVLGSPMSKIIDQIIIALDTRVPKCILILGGATELCHRKEGRIVFNSNVDVIRATVEIKREVLRLHRAIEKISQRRRVKNIPFIHFLLPNLEGTVQRASQLSKSLFTTHELMRFALDKIQKSVNGLDLTYVRATQLKDIIPERFFNGNFAEPMTFISMNVPYYKSYLPNNDGPLVKIFTYLFIHYFGLRPIKQNKTLRVLWQDCSNRFQRIEQMDRSNTTLGGSLLPNPASPIKRLQSKVHMIENHRCSYTREMKQLRLNVVHYLSRRTLHEQRKITSCRMKIASIKCSSNNTELTPKYSKLQSTVHYDVHAQYNISCSKTSIFPSNQRNLPDKTPKQMITEEDSLEISVKTTSNQDSFMKHQAAQSELSSDKEKLSSCSNSLASKRPADTLLIHTEAKRIKFTTPDLLTPEERNLKESVTKDEFKNYLLTKRIFKNLFDAQCESSLYAPELHPQYEQVLEEFQRGAILNIGSHVTHEHLMIIWKNFWNTNFDEINKTAWKRELQKLIDEFTNKKIPSYNDMELVYNHLLSTCNHHGLMGEPLRNAIFEAQAKGSNTPSAIQVFASDDFHLLLTIIKDHFHPPQDQKYLDSINTLLALVSLKQQLEKRYSHIIKEYRTAI